MESAKKSAAIAAVDAHVRSHMVIGIGSGSTIVHAIQYLGEQLASGKLEGIIGVPTSFQSRLELRKAHVPIGDLVEHTELAVAIDGADEVARGTLDAIKGGGGCQTQEKMVASAAKQFILIADEGKRSESLGTVWTKGVPIEVLPDAYALIQRRLVTETGADSAELRMAKAKAGPCVTDNGGFILDAKYGAIADPAALHAQVIDFPGVVETGLFCGMASAAYFGLADGSVEVWKRDA